MKPTHPGDAAAHPPGQETPQPDADSATPASAPVPPGFVGNPEHLAKLKEGVEAWNKWRKENPDIKPDLRGIDFTRAEDFQATPIWGRPGWDENGPERVLLEDANLSGAALWGANLSGADLVLANLRGAGLAGANLNRTDIDHANLSGASLWLANLSGANLSLANLADANVSSITYDRKLLRRGCHGIRAETCYGNAQFKRDVMDQDYLDQIESRIRSGAVNKPDTWLKKAIWSLVIGAGLGFLAAFMMLHQMQAPFDRFTGLPGTLAAHWPVMLAAVMGGTALAGFFAGTAGKIAIFKLWGLFDYGRSWSAVLVFAALMIAVFGTLYYVSNGQHVTLTGEPHPIWFFPWFVAAMGFCTLGISSYAIPLDSIGALLMTANVLAGFLALGLLLSVLGNIFARRA